MDSRSSSPAADVVNENGAEVRLTAFERAQEVLECLTALNACAALARVDDDTTLLTAPWTYPSEQAEADRSGSEDGAAH
jgi:hypothetical protein